MRLLRLFRFGGIGAVFLMGGVAGTLFGAKLERDRLIRQERAAPRIMTEEALHVLTKEVKLDSSQQTRTEALLRAALPGLQAAETNRRESISLTLRQFRAGMDQVLRADQQAAFRSIMDRLEHRMAPDTSPPALSASVRQ